MYELLKRINKLKKTPRMGWLESDIDISEAEDVAQHSFETASITLILSDLLENEIDKGRALEMAIIHDWAESITGDFSRDMSSQLGEGVKESIEEKAMEELLSDDIMGEDYLQIWKEYTKGETPESKIVFLADRLSILIEANRLFKEGKKTEKLREIRRTVREEISPYLQEFPELKGLIEKIDENRSPGKEFPK